MKHIIFDFHKTVIWTEKIVLRTLWIESRVQISPQHCSVTPQELFTLKCVLEWLCFLVSITYSTVQSPSWEALRRFAAGQETPRISRKPKVYYRTHKRPPSVPILGQPNPVYIHTSHLLEIQPIFIHPSTPMSPQWSPSLRFPHQHPIHPPLLTHMRHMPSPSHSSRFYHPQNIGWGVQVI